MRDVQTGPPFLHRPLRPRQTSLAGLPHRLPEICHEYLAGNMQGGGTAGEPWFRSCLSSLSSLLTALGLRPRVAERARAPGLLEGTATAFHGQLAADADLQEDQRTVSQGQGVPLLRRPQRTDP